VASATTSSPETRAAPGSDFDANASPGEGFGAYLGRVGWPEFVLVMVALVLVGAGVLMLLAGVR